LENEELHGYLALLYYFGVADADGKLRFPRGGNCLTFFNKKNLRSVWMEEFSWKIKKAQELILLIRVVVLISCY